MNFRYELKHKADRFESVTYALLKTLFKKRESFTVQFAPGKVIIQSSDFKEEVE